MPIYAYRCSTCGRAKDILRKMSDPALSECPFCGASTFVKQVTAAGFQLKGSGWYVTDFKGDSKAPKAADGDSAPDASKGEGKTGDGAPADGKAADGKAGEGKAAEGKGADTASTASASSAGKSDSAGGAPAAAPPPAGPSAAAPGGGTGPASK